LIDYHSEKVSDDGAGWEHSKIMLSPMSSVGAFGDIELLGEQVESFGWLGRLWRFCEKLSLMCIVSCMIRVFSKLYLPH